MKKGWDKYATEARYIKKGYLRKYSNGNPSWKAPETSSCNSIQQSGKEQKEIEMLVTPPIPESFKKILEEDIKWFGKIVLQTEQVEFIGDQNGKSEIRIGQPIQSSGESSSEIGSSKPSSSRSKSRDGKVRKEKNGENGRSRQKKS